MSTGVEAETSNEATGAAVELTIQPRVRSLGEFDVRRVLPVANHSLKRRAYQIGDVE